MAVGAATESGDQLIRANATLPAPVYRRGMSFEEHWTIERRPWPAVIAAVRDVADRHDLRFWAHSDGDAMMVWVQFPIDAAAVIAAELSDMYTVEQAESELDPLEGEVDFEAARAAGATLQDGIVTRIADGREDEFRTDAPDRYTCQLDIHWDREAPVLVYSNDVNNRAAWPAIIAFADAVVTELGGSWVEP